MTTYCTRTRYTTGSVTFHLVCPSASIHCWFMYRACISVCIFQWHHIAHKNYSHNWIYDVSFSMPVCSHIWLMHFSWHHIAQEQLTQLDLWCFIWYARLQSYMVSLSVCIHNCIVLVVVCAFFNDMMLQRNYSHHWIYDVSFSMSVCMHNCVLYCATQT